MGKIEELIVRDKFTNLEQVSEILKEEITSVARNFFLLSDDVIVRYRREKNNYIFNIEISANRVKPFGNKFVY
ncbi:MAG: hypothetical protein IJ817_00605 [Clostridia bacterium]|nr:hypothetical protein [Clostridia bacterium]